LRRISGGYESMKTLLLVHNDPNSIGGYQRLSLYLQTALSADIYNIHTGTGYNPDDYDYFVAMDDPSVYKLPIDRPHTAYLTTPRRSLYDMYYTNQWYIRAATWLLRVHDRHYMSKISDFVAISHTTRTRIYKTYGKDATVIYPCIECDKFHHGEDKGYWLSVGRIAKWKRIPMIIDAFRDMPDEELVIYGAPASMKDAEMVKDLPPNVHWETGGDAGLIERYAHCRGVITMGVDEDFGYVPLEAMAAGKWVIAPKEGGYLETVAPPLTGVLINPKKSQLIVAVKSDMHRLNSNDYGPIRARKYDCSSFVRQWQNHANLITSEN